MTRLILIAFVATICSGPAFGQGSTLAPYGPNPTEMDAQRLLIYHHITTLEHNFRPSTKSAEVRLDEAGMSEAGRKAVLEQMSDRLAAVEEQRKELGMLRKLKFLEETEDKIQIMSEVRAEQETWDKTFADWVLTELSAADQQTLTKFMLSDGLDLWSHPVIADHLKLSASQVKKIKDAQEESRAAFATIDIDVPRAARKKFMEEKVYPRAAKAQLAAMAALEIEQLTTFLELTEQKRRQDSLVEFLQGKKPEHRNFLIRHVPVLREVWENRWTL